MWCVACGEKARVKRVSHGPGRRRRVIKFQVCARVHTARQHVSARAYATSVMLQLKTEISVSLSIPPTDCIIYTCKRGATHQAE